MSKHNTAFVAAALAALFLPSLPAPSSGYSNLTSVSTSALPTATPIPIANDEEGWVPFDSYGLMMHMAPRSECNEVGCHNHVDSAPTNHPTFATPQKPRHGSRDVVRKNGTLGWSEDGQTLYTLNDGHDENGDDVEEVNSIRKQHDFASDDQLPESQDTLAGSATSLIRRAFTLSSSNLSKRKSKSSKNGKGKNKGSTFNLAKGVSDIMQGSTILTTITWYTGIDLLNPYCDRKSRWTPTDDAMIIAVTEKWSLRPACGEFLEITTQDKGKKDRSIIARVVDLCGGCIPEVPHADLSKAAFQKLYDLDVGRVKGLKMRRVKGPKGKWSNKLYGPKQL